MTGIRALTPEERRILAGELALGLLDGDERVEALNLISQDPDFRRDLAYWDGRFSPLFEEIEPAPPPPSVWSQIESSLLRPVVDPQQSNVVPLRRKLRVWQISTGAASALAASLALILLVQPHSPVQPTAQQEQQSAQKPMVAMLTGASKNPALMASWNPASGMLRVEASAPMPPARGRSHQLWIIPADGTPRSMGIMPESGPMASRVDIPMANNFAEGVVLAVSDEPAGGSPTGAPTGPVVASGKLVKV